MYRCVALVYDSECDGWCQLESEGFVGMSLEKYLRSVGQNFVYHCLVFSKSVQYPTDRILHASDYKYEVRVDTKFSRVDDKTKSKLCHIICFQKRGRSTHKPGQKMSAENG